MAKKRGRPRKAKPAVFRYGLWTRIKFLIFGTVSSLTTKRKYKRRAKIKTIDTGE